jgi:micrococcal nuclease
MVSFFAKTVYTPGCPRRTPTVPKGHFLTLAMFLLTACPALSAPAAPPLGTMEGMVISIRDGDHLTVTNAGTEFDVRLYGVRTPLMARTPLSGTGLPRAGQPCAERAFRVLTQKVLHRKVVVEIMHIDRRGRAVAVIWLEGRDINREMVDEGLAWASRKSREQQPAYLQAEAVARAGRLGLWAQDDPQPPWEFRKAWKSQLDRPPRSL